MRELGLDSCIAASDLRVRPPAARIQGSDIDGQQVYRVEQQGEELGFVVVDSLVEGRARGGLRLVAHLTEIEIRAAARAMTLKYGLLGLPQGGAKAGVHGDPDAPVQQRRDRLLAFAGAIEPLLRTRVYVPDADLGTRADDIRWMMHTRGHPVGRYDWQANRSGDYTAASCAAAVRASLAHRAQPLSGCRVAIEGFGSVGAAVADRLRRGGARIVAVSTSRGALYEAAGLDVDRLRDLAATVGSRLVEAYTGAQQLRREQLLELPVDLLCPCARHHSIHAGNVGSIRAPVICGGANNPVSPDAEQELAGRGIVCVPDFISSCGGVLGGTLEFGGVRPARIVSIVDRYVFETMTALAAVADRRQALLRDVAEPLALSRHREIRWAAEKETLGNHLQRAALTLYRRGWVPRVAVAALAPSHLMKRVVTIDGTMPGAERR